MEFQLPIQINPLPHPVSYGNKILLTGSCFTEHIGSRLQELKFDILQNPNGILFDPHSVATSLVSYIENKQYREDDLFYLNELWQSWQHHSVFSAIDKEGCLQHINESQTMAHTFLKDADFIIITLGSSFSYRLTGLTPNSSSITSSGLRPSRTNCGNSGNHSKERSLIGQAVANCHRAPAQWFTKHMMSIEETSAMLGDCLQQLFQFNAKLKIIFTVSPVRHIRDGVTENNRSKARLIEVVHNLVNKFEPVFYFPAYELVIDVLRDYRFYDIDMVHPNYPATAFVMEKFIQSCIDESSRLLIEEVKKIVTARKHKAFQPATQAHKQFLLVHAEKARELQQRYPFLDLDEEIAYFNAGQPKL